jgi:hypothetical protein
MNVGCMRKGDRARARKRVDSCVQSHDLQMTTGLRTGNPGLGCGYILIADPVLVVATIVSKSQAVPRRHIFWRIVVSLTCSVFSLVS